MEICEEELPTQADPEIRPKTAKLFYKEGEDDYYSTKEKIVVFRNRIYRILHKTYDLYNIYDYFVSESEEMRNTENIVFMIHTNSKKLNMYGSFRDKDRLTYEIFESEREEIKKEDVPAKALECLVNLQIPKVAEVIPYAEIKHNEEHHLAALKKNINEFVDTFMQKICNALESSKKLIDKIQCPYIADELSIKNCCKIYYKFPNSDGIFRPTFKEYFTYLFNKLHPLPIAEYDYNEWIQHTVYELLCKKYSFMTINYVGAPHYIEVLLPTKRMLY